MGVLTDEMKHEIDHEAALYERRQAVCIDALRIVQRHTRWIDDAAIREVAAYLGMTAEELDSVATFYNGIYRRPVGRHVIRLCTSVSCWVLRYEDIQKNLRESLGIRPGETTKDGRFTLIPVQCLGTCDRAPALMIDDDLHQDVTPESLGGVLARYE